MSSTSDPGAAVVLVPAPRAGRRSARRATVALVAGLSVLLGLGTGATRLRADETRGFEMSVGVTLLTVTVAVLDNRGRYRTNLEQEDFELLVDGKPVEIAEFSRTENEPLDLAVLLDVSGSMRFNDKIERARVVLQDLLRRLRPDDQTALMFFADGRIETAVPFTAEREPILQAMRKVEAYGKTALADAMAEAVGLVAKHESLSPALILISDGFENASRSTMGQTLELLRFRGVPVYPLAVVAEHVADEARHPDAGSDFELLRKIAAETGGRPFVVTSPASLVGAVAGIERDLRARYRLGFYGPDSETSQRTLTVNVTGKKFKVRYRRGYKP